MSPPRTLSEASAKVVAALAGELTRFERIDRDDPFKTFTKAYKIVYKNEGSAQMATLLVVEGVEVVAVSSKAVAKGILNSEINPEDDSSTNQVLGGGDEYKEIDCQRRIMHYCERFGSRAQLSKLLGAPTGVETGVTDQQGGVDASSDSEPEPDGNLRGARGLIHEIDVEEDKDEDKVSVVGSEDEEEEEEEEGADMSD
jgi:hypothetical protein